MSEYLTEKNLGLILDELLPGHDFIRDRAVPGAGNGRLRPDYRSDKRMLILEFDGYHHYSQAKRIKADADKDRRFAALCPCHRP